MADKISFVFVPGAFSQPSVYDRVVESLLQKDPNISVALIALPSTDVNRVDGPATLADDANHISREIEQLAMAGNNVILVMTSYGGFPGSESCRGLSRTYREKHGMTGGIVSLVYIASFLPRVGESVRTLMVGHMPKAADTSNPYMELTTPVNIESSVASASEAASGPKRYHSNVSYSGLITYAGYMNIASVFFYCKQDRTILPEIQMRMIQRAQDDGAKIRVVESESGHNPFATNVDEVVQCLLNTKLLAGENQI